MHQTPEIAHDQVFSLSYGSVNDELNMKSRKGRNNWTNTLVKIRESGAHVRSYRDGPKPQTLNPKP